MIEDFSDHLSEPLLVGGYTDFSQVSNYIFLVCLSYKIRLCSFSTAMETFLSSASI